MDNFYDTYCVFFIQPHPDSPHSSPVDGGNAPLVCQTPEVPEQVFLVHALVVNTDTQLTYFLCSFIFLVIAFNL